MVKDNRPTLRFIRLYDDTFLSLEDMIFVSTKGGYFLLSRFLMPKDIYQYYLYPCDKDGEVDIEDEPIFEKKSPMRTPIPTVLQSKYKVEGIE